MNPLTGAIRSRAQFRNHATWDVNASFARIKCSCVSLEAPATPSNGISTRCSGLYDRTMRELLLEGIRAKISVAKLWGRSGAGR